MTRSTNRYNQLDLLSYTVEPQEAGEKLPQLAEPPRSIDRTALAPRVLWHETRAAFYLRLMSKLMTGDRCNQQVRRQEIARLHELRQQELAIVDRLKQ